MVETIIDEISYSRSMEHSSVFSEHGQGAAFDVTSDAPGLHHVRPVCEVHFRIALALAW